MINAKRIEEDFNKLARIGRIDSNNGLTRLAYSKEETKAHDYVKKVLKALSLETKVDSFGNLHGRMEGNGMPIIIGSHLDTVKNGGRYDGSAGIVSGLEVIRCIKESKIKFKHPVELIVFRGEESRRFGKPSLGSGLLTGLISKNDLDRLKDNDATLRKAIRDCGIHLGGSTLNSAKAYLELHIEQGDILDKKKIQIGIVTGIASSVRYKITVYGRKGHSGTTPLNSRRDAVDGASEMILAREKILMAEHKKGRATVATVGIINVPSGSINVISGKVEFYLDLRDIDIKNRDETEKLILKTFDRIAKKRKLQLKYGLLERKMPVELKRDVQGLIENSCKKLKIKYIFMPSGASHDAIYFSYKGIPTGMIFVPSKNGISHAPEEYTEMKDIVTGAEVLLETVLELNKR